MRHPLRTARRLANGRVLAAASLAGFIAVTSGGTLARADEDAETVAAPVDSTVTDVAAPATVPAADGEVSPPAQHAARAVLVRKQLAFRAKAAKVRSLRSRIVNIAKDQVGDRYRTGSAGPDAFDCSGLVAYVYKKAMGKNLPHQSRAQYTKVKKIKKAQAHPGDLVFFFRNGAHHVAVYLGHNRIVHARGVGRPVATGSLSSDWARGHVTGFGRIVEEPRPA